MFVLYGYRTLPSFLSSKHLPFGGPVLALSLVQYYRAAIDILVRPAIISTNPLPNGRAVQGGEGVHSSGHPRARILLVARSNHASPVEETPRPGFVTGYLPTKGG